MALQADTAVTERQRKQTEQLRKERVEECALEQFQRLQEAAGGKTVIRRVDWMYSGPGGKGATSEAIRIPERSDSQEDGLTRIYRRSEPWKQRTGTPMRRITSRTTQLSPAGCTVAWNCGGSGRRPLQGP